MEDRLKQIQKYRDVDNLTLEQIGKKLRPPVTAERVRQILERQNLKQCAIHKTFFEKECYKCKQLAKHKELTDKLKKDGIWNDIQRLAKPARQRVIVAERTILIKKLYRRYKLSFRLIGRLLKRDHASVMHLYYEDMNT